MFQLGKTIVSEDIIEKEFVCNLSACKGACCIEGEAGAPVTEEETKILHEIYPKIKPFLRKEGITAIEKLGTHVISEQKELETPLVNGKECAYITFSNLPPGQVGKGVAGCGIEEAYNAGNVNFKKPISCHLYPIRVQDYSEFAAVNFHKWPICNDACMLGKNLKIPIYKFVKEALIRRFGENWYFELEKVASTM